MEATKMKQNPMVQKMLDLNAEHSEAFVNQQRSRHIYREQYPTEIGIMKCMDGRVHMPVSTNTPLGILQPWRNIGGKFNLGWAHYKDTITEWVDYAASRKRRSVVFTTYHYARGFKGENAEVVRNRGCAGFEYNTEAAKAASWELKQQYDRVFKNDSLYAINVGVETDLDALIFHGEDGKQVLDLGETVLKDDEEIVQKLKSLYPQIPDFIINDLVPLVRGNIKHVQQIKDSNRPAIDMEHKERVLAIGRGFDWLHEPNLALIIGPYDPDLDGVIVKAAGLLKKNIDEGRINPDEGIVLLTSAPYRQEGFKRRLAEEKAKVLAEFAYKEIQKHVPELISRLSVVTATCDMNTRKLNVL